MLYIQVNFQVTAKYMSYLNGLHQQVVLEKFLEQIF